MIELNTANMDLDVAPPVAIDTSDPWSERQDAESGKVPRTGTSHQLRVGTEASRPYNLT